MGCHASAPACSDSVEVAQSSTTLLERLVIDSAFYKDNSAKIRTSNNVDHLFKALDIQPIIIKCKPSQGVRLQPCSVVPSSVFLNCIESAGRFDPDTARSPMLYSSEMRAMLSGKDAGDNSILCLTYLAGSITRIVSKLQRERILSAIKLTEKIERGSSNIHESLQKQIASSEIQFKRTLETSRLLKVKGGSERICNLIKDGVAQFQFVSSKLQAHREKIAAACASLGSRSAEEVSVNSPLQSWCARYNLVCGGRAGYDAFIERLICWVALAISSIPNMGSAEENSNHQITQTSCVLVMVFKEQLTRERTFLASKSRSLMLAGGNAQKIFAILDNTRATILKAMDNLASEEHSPIKEYMEAKDCTPQSQSSPATTVDMDAIDVHTIATAQSLEKSIPLTNAVTDPGPTVSGWLSDKPPPSPGGVAPMVDMLRKLEDLQEVLRNEDMNLPLALEASTVYMAWFQSTQHFYDLIELSLSGLMRHFVLSVPADTACFPIDLERTVPMAEKHVSPQMGELKASDTPATDKELCDLSEGLVGEIIEGLRRKKYTRIVALVGAGISVSAGVPDFRSPGGLYDQMRKQGFQHPMQVFTSDFLTENPEQFYKVFSQIRTDDLSPTQAHEFIRLLDEHGCLLRCYTQNIDGLERKAGLPTERLVEAHGTMCEARCLQCGKASTPEVLWSEWEAGRLPRCSSQGCKGLLRPSVVFFGEQLNPKFVAMSADDMANADLVLIMGTSLSVEPFASLPQKASRAVPRLLINRHVPYVMQRRPWELLTPSALAKRRPMRKDASIIGECDAGVLQIMRTLSRDLRWGDTVSRARTL